MSNRQLLLSWTKSRAQDSDSILTDLEWDDALEQAVQEYSKRRPRRIAQDYVGDGSTYLFVVPTSWAEEWSVVLSVEAPQGEDEPVYLDESMYNLYRAPAGLQLRFVGALDSGTTARVLYTGLHNLTATSTTIPSNHYRPVSTLAASWACEMLSSHYAGQKDSTLTLDTAEHRTRSEHFQMRARRLRDNFDMHVPEQWSRHVKVARR